MNLINSCLKSIARASTGMRSSLPEPRLVNNDISGCFILKSKKDLITLNNTSDSLTEYIDHWGIKHNVWTKPNSLMIVKADSYKHGVKPVTKGTREILKMIYTPTHTINEKNKMAYNYALT